MPGTDLSIVIVAYRCSQLLRACLESLALAAKDFLEAGHSRLEYDGRAAGVEPR
jgi:hypothetical protein